MSIQQRCQRSCSTLCIYIFLNVTGDRWHMTYNMWNLTHYTWHMTNDTFILEIFFILLFVFLFAHFKRFSVSSMRDMLAYCSKWLTIWEYFFLICMPKMCWEKKNPSTFFVASNLKLLVLIFFCCSIFNNNKKNHYLTGGVSTELAPLGRFIHKVAMTVCLDVCLFVLLNVFFFPRPLIDHEITWSVQGLSLVRPPSLPHPNLLYPLKFCLTEKKKKIFLIWLEFLQFFYCKKKIYMYI